MDWILNNGDNVVMAVSALIALASAVVALTPTEKDDNIMGRVVNIWGKVKGLLSKKK